MSERMLKGAAVLLLLTLTGCATVPSGPSVMVLPAAGKSFESFQSEDALCRMWARQQIGISAQDAMDENTTRGAAVGTVIGAGIGALLGAASGNAGVGAAIGAGGGLLAGTATGADNARMYGYQAQRRYDNSYIQCMYAKGNQVPGVRASYSRSPPPPPRGYSAPPPPAGYAPESGSVPAYPPADYPPPADL
jgi:hypothetical protein